MKFELKKEELMNLSFDQQVISTEITRHIVGGEGTPPGWISMDPNKSFDTNLSCNHVPTN